MNVRTAGAEQNIIRFYSTKDAYGCFSNFAAYPIMLDEKQWFTTEHYFQAQKFHDEEYREKIRLTKSPMLCARLGRSRKVPIRSDWESVKLDMMRAALYAKFTQHADLRGTLLSTGDSELIEHTKNDRFWGDGGDGRGKNMLGILLMELRDRLRSEN